MLRVKVWNDALYGLQTSNPEAAQQSHLIQLLHRTNGLSKFPQVPHLGLYARSTPKA